METKKALKVINVWIEAEKTLLAGSKDGTWTHGKHYGSLEYLYQVKELLGVKDKQTESLESKALKSFKALVESEECRQFMEEYYGNDK